MQKKGISMQKKPSDNKNRNKSKSNGDQKSNRPPKNLIKSNLTTSRSQAVRAQRRSQQDAQRVASQFQAASENRFKA
jgi:hypothetical protein